MHTNMKARVQAKLFLPLHPIAWDRLSLNYFIQTLSTHLSPDPNSGVTDTYSHVSAHPLQPGLQTCTLYGYWWCDLMSSGPYVCRAGIDTH